MVRTTEKNTNKIKYYFEFDFEELNYLLTYFSFKLAF